MVVIGIISTVLYFAGYNLRVLLWIDLWGAAAGWALRIVLIILGAVLYFAGKRNASPGPGPETK